MRSGALSRPTRVRALSEMHQRRLSALAIRPLKPGGIAMTKKWLLSIFALALVGTVPPQITPTSAKAQDHDDAKQSFELVLKLFDAGHIASSNG